MLVCLLFSYVWVISSFSIQSSNEHILIETIKDGSILGRNTGYDNCNRVANQV